MPLSPFFLLRWVTVIKESTTVSGKLISTYYNSQHYPKPIKLCCCLEIHLHITLVKTYLKKVLLLRSHQKWQLVDLRICSWAPGASAGIPASENHKASVKQAATGETGRASKRLLHEHERSVIQMYLWCITWTLSLCFNSWNRETVGDKTTVRCMNHADIY